MKFPSIVGVSNLAPFSKQAWKSESLLVKLRMFLLKKTIISSCKRDKKFKCTDGKQLRDFLFVDDFTSLVIKICNKKKINKGIYNVGFGKTVKIKFVIETIRKIIGKGKPLFGAIKMRKDETKILFPDIAKTKKEFDWKPKITFFKGIKNILN